MKRERGGWRPLRREHPLERIMGIEDTKEGALVTTTDAHLARRIAEALHSARA